MNTFVNISSMQVSNLLSGFIGALLGALSSFLIAIYANKRASVAMETERLQSHVATAVILAGQLFENYLSFNPHLLNQSIFGLRVEENSLHRIKHSIQLHEEAKYQRFLLPELLRYRWDMMLVLISEFGTMERSEASKVGRAQMDVEHYIQYVRDSCVDFLDGKEMRRELKRPYLNRDDAVAWIQSDQD
jgi:hypothetical protein